MMADKVSYIIKGIVARLPGWRLREAGDMRQHWACLYRLQVQSLFLFSRNNAIENPQAVEN